MPCVRTPVAALLSAGPAPEATATLPFCSIAGTHKHYTLEISWARLPCNVLPSMVNEIIFMSVMDGQMNVQTLDNIATL